MKTPKNTLTNNQWVISIEFPNLTKSQEAEQAKNDFRQAMEDNDRESIQEALTNILHLKT